MFNQKERKLERLEANFGKELTPKMYNLVLGASVAYGIITSIILAFVGYPVMMLVNPIIFMILYFVAMIVGTIMSAKSTNPIVSFVGYNFICMPIGLLLAATLPSYAISVVLSAALLTTVISILMTVASTIYPELFAGLGKALFVSLIITLIVDLLSFFFGFGFGIIDYIAACVFSLYIGYDFYVAQRYPKTLDNAIDSSVDIYLDVINLFIRLLSIMSRKD